MDPSGELFFLCLFSLSGPVYYLCETPCRGLMLGPAHIQRPAHRDGCEKRGTREKSAGEITLTKCVLTELCFHLHVVMESL